MRSRITFETDVVNDYFDRLQNPGRFTLVAELHGASVHITTYSLNLQNGKATLNLRLPPGISIGDSINYTAKVQDDTLLFPFTNVFVVTVGQPQDVKPSAKKPNGKPPSKESGDDRDVPSGLQFPEVNRVYEPDWTKRKHKFDQCSALEVIQESAVDDNPDGDQPIYSFWINMDNIYLKTEKKYTKNSPDIIDARYEVGLTLLGLALIQSHIQSEKSEKRDEENGHNEEQSTLEEEVYNTTAAIAPILLPLIDSLGSLTEEQAKVGGQAGDDD